MARTDWRYYDAETCISGTMRCCGCGKPITAGQYRSREATHAYVNQHRACSEFDPKWAKTDAENAARAEQQAAFEAACALFRERWRGFDLSQVAEGAPR